MTCMERAGRAREGLSPGEPLGTAHLLLGLLRVREGLAAQALARLGVTEHQVWAVALRDDP
jgi:hypothetical protein